jgi:hypothetical protein
MDSNYYDNYDDFPVTSKGTKSGKQKKTNGDNSCYSSKHVRRVEGITSKVTVKPK